MASDHTIGEKVRFYRLLERKTMRQLAANSGCSLDTIWRLENGHSNPRYDTMGRVAKALGVSWQDLYVEPLPKKPEQVAGRGRRSKNKKRR